MPKIQYKCIDCGKLSNFITLRNSQSLETYRCRECALNKMHKDPVWREKVSKHCKEMAQDPDWIEKQKIRNQKRVLLKIQHACIDCGKLSALKPPYHLQPPEKYRCKRCAIRETRRIKQQDPVWIERQSIRIEKQRVALEALEKKKAEWKLAQINVQYTCIDCGKLSTWRFPSTFRQPRETYRCESCAIKQMHRNPVTRQIHTLARKKMYQDPKWKESVINGARKRAKDPVARANALAAREILYQNPIFRENLLISITGTGFWYGHPVLCIENQKNRKIYCEKWNTDLKCRIDAAWEYRSAISGVTRFENFKQESLSRHHVYWQERACCKWDEDANGYYATINLGNKRKPRWYKHYIKGDPNKFVLLTRAEHKLIEGNFKNDMTKLTWIKYFEDLIEKREKEGKPCYLSKEEYEIYKIEHADTIALYDTLKRKKNPVTKQLHLMV